MFGLGLPELIVILVVVLLFFGSKRLPSVSKDVGESMRSLKDGFTGGNTEKSFKDIASEVKSSAQEIKKGVDSVKGSMPKGPGPQPPNQPPNQNQG